MSTQGDYEATISDNLQEIMRFRELSAIQLAKKSGVPQPRISEIVTGQTLNPQLKTLRKLAKALSVSIGELTSEKGVLVVGDRMETSEAIHLKDEESRLELDNSERHAGREIKSLSVSLMEVIIQELRQMDDEQKRAVLAFCMQINGAQYELVKRLSPEE